MPNNTWLKILRSITPGNRPSGRLYGEPYVNLGENQFGVMDSGNNPRDLIGVPFFSPNVNYSSGYMVQYQGFCYIAQGSVSAGAFNVNQWSLVASRVYADSKPILPGGRLSLNGGTPVMNSSYTSQSIYYEQYASPYVPIWNGAYFQPVYYLSGSGDQTGLTLPMGGGASWVANTNWDIYVTLYNGNPTLAGVQWSSDTVPQTRVWFGGLPVNAGAYLGRISAGGSISIPQYQGTFLGSIRTNASAGTTNFTYGTAASGGGAGSLLVSNYWHRQLVHSLTVDNGANYNYGGASGSAWRVARGSAGNQCYFLNCTTEMPIQVSRLVTVSQTSGLNSVFWSGIGLNTAGNMIVQQRANSYAASTTANSFELQSACVITNQGYGVVMAIESGDATHDWTIAPSAMGRLGVSIWA